MKISVIGTGYVGLTTGSCLAELGHTVLCVDIDAGKIASLERAEVPFHEPGLQELVAKNKAKGRLRFTTNVQEGVLFAEALFNCVGTPSKSGGEADLQAVYAVAEKAAQYARSPLLFITKSTVPPGTSRRCRELITSLAPRAEIEVVANPEFLAEGKAVHDFTHPDKIVVGAQSEKAFALLRRLYTGRLRTYIPFLETDWETAEMIKYANNAFLATKISFINEMANICDLAGADIKLLAQALGMDYRINPKFLNAGVGFGGSCFPKDLRALAAMARAHHFTPLLLDTVLAVNERQKKKMLEKAMQHFGEQHYGKNYPKRGNSFTDLEVLKGKTFTIWGLSFKPKTSDCREAPALALLQELLRLGCTVRTYDPVALEEARRVIGGMAREIPSGIPAPASGAGGTAGEFAEEAAKAGEAVKYCSSMEDSVRGSHGIFLMTEWDEFRNAPLAELGELMLHKVIFDGRNVYGPEAVREEGFAYYGVGQR